ncbi:iron-sulfur cluster protein ISCU [Cardiosporidium cionae]|uniref:Iron-sulfur cluster assembly protein n=1 Tax=Cardiosporidium cionae TaxID=476202 RepID=A0ABQ7JDL4_9APIC|nr:iron-sulfur cluster protein ISCU [Cardiosporidium cionae]|eukprot:KAF8822117.1 iron-sulfur cluster protein ISCU [Cardiosporidium cionae]
MPKRIYVKNCRLVYSSFIVNNMLTLNQLLRGTPRLTKFLGVQEAFFAPISPCRSSSLLSPGRQVRYYSDEVREHFQNPKNVGKFDKNDNTIGTAIVGKAACGDVIKLQVKVENDTIVDAKFKTFGCGSAIASSSYVTELIKGKSCSDALHVKNTEIAEHLKLPPVKIHCSLLAEDAVRHAISDYQQKQSETSPK